MTVARPGSAPIRVKAMTYNLQWWSLYGFRNGNNSSASQIMATVMPDVIGLQECDDVSRVLSEGGLSKTYKTVIGPNSLAIAFKSSDWELLCEGSRAVAVDGNDQFYGARCVQWARFGHKSTGVTLLFMNHHGPLRINSGGRLGGTVTADCILRAVHGNVEPGDAVILLGTFNAQAGSKTVRRLERFLPLQFSGKVYKGIDHFFSQLFLFNAERLGCGGSDHEALVATFLA